MESVASVRTDDCKPTTQRRQPPQRLSAEAKQRLRDIKLDDIDTLWSFRMSGAGRFWCLKHENIYSLLWWDPNHEVYPVSKRNT